MNMNLSFSSIGISPEKIKEAQERNALQHKDYPSTLDTKPRTIPKLIHKPLPIRIASEGDAKFERKRLVGSLPEDLNIEKLIGAAQFDKERCYTFEYYPSEEGWKKRLVQIRGTTYQFPNILGKDILIKIPDDSDLSCIGGIYAFTETPKKRSIFNGRYGNVISVEYGNYLVGTKDYTKFTGNIQSFHHSIQRTT